LVLFLIYILFFFFFSVVFTVVFVGCLYINTIIFFFQKNCSHLAVKDKDFLFLVTIMLQSSNQQYDIAIERNVKL